MENRMLAGVGKVDITCPEGELAYGLYPEKAKAHIPLELLDKKVGVDDPLFAKALVLDNGSSRMVIITMDVTGIGCRTTSQDILFDSADDFVPNLRERLTKELGIPGDNVSVCASHNHPPGRILCDDQEQLDRVFDAVKQAVDNLTPVAIGIGSGRDDRLTINRACRDKNGMHGLASPFFPDEEAESPGPVDPEIGVIRIDRLDGTPLAVVYNFASHILGCSPNDNISAGFPGVTSGFLEKNLGNGSMAFFINGTLGDVMEIASPSTAKVNPRSSCETGLMLAQSILEAYNEIKPSSTDFKVVSVTTEFPLRTDIPDVIASIKQEQAELTESMGANKLRVNFKSFMQLFLQYRLFPDFPSQYALRYMQADQTGDLSIRASDRRNRLDIENYLKNIYNMEKMSRNEFKMQTLRKHQEIIDTLGGKSVPAEIQGIKIGDSVMITTPMEVLTEIGLNVKKKSPFKHTYIASITNGYLHYSPPASYYPLGSYESIECFLAPEWEAIFEKTVQDIFEKLKAK